MCHFLSLSDARAIDNKQASHAYPRRITKAQLGAHKPVVTEGVTGDGSYIRYPDCFYLVTTSARRERRGQAAGDLEVAVVRLGTRFYSQPALGRSRLDP